MSEQLSGEQLSGEQLSVEQLSGEQLSYIQANDIVNITLPKYRTGLTPVYLGKISVSTCSKNKPANTGDKGFPIANPYICS